MILTLIIIGWLLIGGLSTIWKYYMEEEDVFLTSLILGTLSGIATLIIALIIFTNNLENHNKKITIIKWKKKI